MNKTPRPPDNAPVSGGTAHFAPFLGTIIDTTGIGLWDWELDTGKVIYSRQWEAIAGYAEGELPQTVDSWTRAVLPEDLPYAEAEIDRHLRGETGLYEAEFRMVRKDGSVVWAQDRGVVTQRDANGRPTRLIGVLQDVTRIKQTEHALKEKSEQLDFVAHICGLGMWDWNIPGGTILYNNDYLEMLGYSTGEVTGSMAEWEGLNHPEDLPAVDKALDDYISGRSDSYVIETRMRHKDGHYIWTLDTGRIVEWDENGKPVRVLGGHLNIDDLKQAELAANAALAENARYNERLQAEIETAVAQLRQSEEFSRTMFEASPYVSVLFDDQLQLVDCNPEAVEFFGFADREDLLQNLVALINAGIPEYQPDGRRSVPLAERFRTVIKTGGIDFETEFLLRGRGVPMRVSFRRVPYKGSFAVALYMIDLTSLRDAKNELLRQDYLLRTVNAVANELVGASPDVFEDTIWRCMGDFAQAVGAQRMYIWRNVEQEGSLACEQVYEWTQDVAAQPQTLFAADDENRADYEQLQSLYDTLSQGIHINAVVKDVPRMQSRLFAQSGIQSILVLPVIMQDSFWGFVGFDNCKSERLFSKTEIKVLESGSIILVASILRNELTKNLILAREEALASTRAKTDFLSRMSHEIRTPMNAIIGMNTIARKTRDYNKIQYCMDKIDTASGQLLDIINDILDMSKIESGKFEMTEAEFDFEKMMQGVFDVIQLRVDQNGQTLAVRFDSLFESMVICDELRLSQVMNNLLSNAVKFTPPGGQISVRVSHHQSEAGVPVLRVEVEDTGIGISPAQRERMFQSFEQGDGGATRKYGGTGLGLAICKRIVEMMGGDIWVESELGKGSTFLFELSFAWGRPLKSTIAKNQLPAGLSLLAVDGSEEARAYYSSLMEGFRLACDVAADGGEAVAMVQKAQDEGRPYDLAFVDWATPGMGGAGTARKIREIAGTATTIVMVSAVDWSEIEPGVRDIGVTEYLSKPILPSILFNTILRLTGATLVSPAQAPQGAVYHWAEKNILLVEDLPINREIIHGILEDTGVNITNAENGRIGVDAYLASPDKYDLILMDMQMPELDGLDATRQIRASGKANARTIPILAMTANAFKEDVENCIAAGMDGHIAKPVDVDTLMEMLEKYLG